MSSDLCEEDSTFLEGITQLLHDRRKKINTTFEEEKNSLHALQKQIEELHKENAKLRKENSVLREEISFLQLASNEKDEQLRKLEARKEELALHSREWTMRWSKMIETINRKCTCGGSKALKMTPRGMDTATPLVLSPSIKVKNASNVFFMSPVKPKNNGVADVVLAPLSEDYLTEHIDASTPVMVPETKRHGVRFESNNSDSGEQEEMGSPSLFTDHDSKNETPAASKRLTKKKGKDTPGTEVSAVSAVLFSDRSLADDHMNKTSDVSDELNVHFNRLSADASIEGNEEAEVLIIEDELPIGNDKENIRDEVEAEQHPPSHFQNFQEPDLPIVKKRKSAPSEESEQNDSKSPLGLKGFKNGPNGHRNNDSFSISLNDSWSGSTSETTCSKENSSKKNSSVLKTWLGSEKATNAKSKPSSEMKQTKQITGSQSTNARQYSFIKAANSPTKHDAEKSTSPTAAVTVSSSKSTADKNHPSTSTAQTTNSSNNPRPFKYDAVVRKKDERAKLPGFACEECRRYYESDNLPPERLAEVLKQCSRHKHASAPPPSTPPQFWALDFPQTQECRDKGYMLDENHELPSYVKPKFKRRKKKNADGQ